MSIECGLVVSTGWYAGPSGASVVGSQKPSGYPFLPQLADCAVDQISIEAAQPQLDLGILRDFAKKTIVLGVIDLGYESIETPEIVAERIRKALKFVKPGRDAAAPRGRRLKTGRQQ